MPTLSPGSNKAAAWIHLLPIWAHYFRAGWMYPPVTSASSLSFTAITVPASVPFLPHAAALISYAHADILGDHLAGRLFLAPSASLPVCVSHLSPGCSPLHHNCVFDKRKLRVWTFNWRNWCKNWKALTGGKMQLELLTFISVLFQRKRLQPWLDTQPLYYCSAFVMPEHLCFSVSVKVTKESWSQPSFTR